MSKRLLYALVLITVSGLSAFICVMYFTDFLIKPQSTAKLEAMNFDPALTEASNWVVTLWNSRDSSWGKIEDSSFKVYFEPIRLDEWGNVAITLGNQAHASLANAGPLKERLVVHKECYETC